MAEWTGRRALTLLERHGAMLQAGRGPLPSLAEAIAGEPIRGSWWGHAKGKLIFNVLQELYDSKEFAACKLTGKVTLIHRRLWPALRALAGDGPCAPLDRVSQVHTETGEHRNVVEPWPAWLPAELAMPSDAEARAQLGPLANLITFASASPSRRASRRASPAKARRRATSRAKR